MHDLGKLLQGNYREEKAIRLCCGLETFPLALLKCKRLERLDLSGNKLSSLPDNFTELHNLQVFFASDNCFEIYPSVLAQMPKLRVVAFRNNAMKCIEEDSINPELHWLILTNNKLTQLPKSIGQCSRLQKIMLAGNLLESLPTEMSQLRNLELLRLSVNKFDKLPDWLPELPSLAFLAFGGNPVLQPDLKDSLARLPWDDFTCTDVLGQGASGVIHKAKWISADTNVAIKLFKGQLTSDGSPTDELLACIAAGQHDNIIDTMAEICDHPYQQRGLVLQLIPASYSVLAGPPSLESCTRDVFSEKQRFTWPIAHNILGSVAAAALHLHTRGIAHGDLYAHNTLVDDSGHALLGDFGAATIYGLNHRLAPLLEKIEVRAFGYMIDDLLSRCETINSEIEFIASAQELRQDCLNRNVHERPSFRQILTRLTNICPL